MTKVKLSILAAIALGILIALALTQNASSVGPHLVPPLAEPATVTPIPYSKILDLAPNTAEGEKSILIVRHSDGTYTKMLIAPGTQRSQVPLNGGDQIIAVLPPNSFRVNKLSPIGSPISTGTHNAENNPTPAPQPGGQEPYSGNEP